MEDSKTVYNKFSLYPEVSYNIISYLIDNTDTLWRLLKYNDPNAWKIDTDHPNLTKAEKGALVYDGSPNETDFRIFLDLGQDSSWTIQSCSIRICPLELFPTNHIYGNMSVAFEIYSHYKINHLTNYQTRLDLVTQQLIETLNGQEVGALGRLYFDRRSSSRCKVTTMGQVPYKGKALIMCNWVV